MVSNYEKGQEAEKIAKDFLQKKFACAFEPKKLRIGTTSEGKPAMHNFDLVSRDGLIVAEVKAHTLTISGYIPSGKISNTYEACSMLEKANAAKKFLLLTDPAFFLTFKKCSDGKIDSGIIVQLIPTEETNNPVNQSKIEETNEGSPLPTGLSFDNFWNELATFLSTRRAIKNWTICKGYFGEDFDAAYNSGKILVYSPSAIANSQKVHRQDLKLVFDNWQKYVSKTISRAELCKSSYVTKYAISIIHEYLSEKAC